MWTARTTQPDLADQLSSLRQTPTPRSHARPHHDQHRLLHLSKLARYIYARQFRLFHLRHRRLSVPSVVHDRYSRVFWGETLPESHSRPPNAAVACETNRHDYRDHDPFRQRPLGVLQPRLIQHPVIHHRKHPNHLRLYHHSHCQCPSRISRRSPRVFTRLRLYPRRSILGATNTAGVFSCLIANKFIASSVSTSTNTGFAKVFLALALMYVFCGTLWIRTMKGDRLGGKKNVVAL